MGDLEGLFVCTQEDYDKALGKEAYFDEPLGKHSEYCITLGPDNVAILNVPESAVKVLVEAIGHNDISGFNVVEMALEQYAEENEDEEEE
jgi:hypothetical protein